MRFGAVVAIYLVQGHSYEAQRDEGAACNEHEPCHATTAVEWGSGGAMCV